MRTRIAILNPTALLTKANLFYAVIFTLPMITHGPQLVVGTAVNTMLFLGAVKLTKKKLLPLAILPSLGALANGVLFGSFTMLLVYFAPAIWFSNYLMMTIFKKTASLPTLLSIIISSLTKAALLFSIAFIMFNLNIIPKIFLSIMGTTQIATAVVGGLIALGINKSGVINNE